MLSPDIVMNLTYGEVTTLEEFHKFILPVKFAFPENVYFLYFGNEKFTRLVEYKNLQNKNMMRTQL